MCDKCNRDCDKCRQERSSKERSCCDKGSVYAQLSSDIDQKPRRDPIKIKLNLTDAIDGVGHDNSNPEDIHIEKSGPYFIVAAPQTGTCTKFCPSYADFWLRVNNKDVPNSNIRLQFATAATKDVIVLQAIVELKRGDLLNVLMSGNGDTFIEAIKPENEPLVPSIIFSLFKI